MAELEKRPEKKTKIEQLVVERFFKINIPDPYSFLTDCKTFAEDNWLDSIDKYRTYRMRDLLKEGYKIKSWTKVFCTEENRGHFGIETVILEKETTI